MRIYTKLPSNEVDIDQIRSLMYLDGVNFCNFFSTLVQVNNVLHGELVVFNDLSKKPVFTCIN